jgi:hypothetical protein
MYFLLLGRKMCAELSLFNDLRGEHHGQKLLLRKNGKAT